MLLLFLCSQGASHLPNETVFTIRGYIWSGSLAWWLARWLRSVKLIYVGRSGPVSTEMGDRVRVAGHSFWYVINESLKANSAFYPSGVGKWVPVSAGKAKAGMVHSVSGCTRDVQVKLWDLLRMRAIPERLRGVFTTRRYTNPRLLLPLPKILRKRNTKASSHSWTVLQYRLFRAYFSDIQTMNYEG